jgi:hypothetical protein
MATRAQDNRPVTRLELLVRTLLLGATVSLGSACGVVDDVRQGVDRMGAVSASLERTIGARPQVGFQYHNGALATVSVTYDTLPAGRSLEEIIRVSADAVKAEFKESPKSLIIGFEVHP